MINREIVSKLAEAIYLRRKQNNWPGDADGDWLYAERMWDFFEGNTIEERWMEERDREDYRWIYPLYLQMKNLGGVIPNGQTQ